MQLVENNPPATDYELLRTAVETLENIVDVHRCDITVLRTMNALRARIAEIDRKTRAEKTGGERIVRMAELSKRLGVSESMLFALVKRGEFPRPFQLFPNGRAVGWTATQIDEWLLTRAATAETICKPSPN